MIKDIASMAGGILKPVAELIDQISTTDEEKQKLKNEIAVAGMKAKEAIITAELQQDDKYTKRARPTIVYVGLGAFILNYILFPWISYFSSLFFSFELELPTIQFPSEFWYAWGGVTGVYAWRRSTEKKEKRGSK